MRANRTYRDRDYRMKIAAVTMAALITAAVFGAVSAPSYTADIETRSASIGAFASGA